MRLSATRRTPARAVSVLFNEPKLLKFEQMTRKTFAAPGFSALQRAEIAEIDGFDLARQREVRFSALQRAEIAEIRTS